MLVIGAGPGGIQAALTASRRGHHVTLMEKENKVGGKLEIVAAPSYKKQYLDYLNYQEYELKESDVTVLLGTEATMETVDSCHPDTVIIAAGAQPIIPPLKGIEKAVTADEVLSGAGKVSGTVVIVGGGLVGCETAHVLSEQGSAPSCI